MRNMAKQAVFIRLENTFEEAMQYRNSPNMSFYSFRGVQLIKTIYPYIQRTYTETGIELENFVVTVRDVCTNQSLGVLPTDTIQIKRNFQDRNGIPQVEWAINTDNQDFGDQLIYLDFLQGVNEHIYSSPFYWTDYNSQFTSRYDYKALDSEQMLSIQLNVWFLQPLSEQTIDVYDPVGGGRAVVGGNLIEYEKYRFNVSDIYLYREFLRMMYNTYIYIDLYKCNLYKAAEFPVLQGKENFAEMDIELYVDYENKYNPFFMPIVPPIPPVEPMQIILSVVAGDFDNFVYYNTVVSGFDPENFIYQYSGSPDGPWITSEIGPADPSRLVESVDLAANNWYFQVTDPVTGVTSNVVQLTPPILNIGFVTGAKDRGLFSVYYDYGTGIFQVGDIVEVQFSQDGVNWFNSNVDQSSIGTRPYIQVSTSNINRPFTPNFCRLYYPRLNLYSNVVTII